MRCASKERDAERFKYLDGKETEILEGNLVLCWKDTLKSTKRRLIKVT